MATTKTTFYLSRELHTRLKAAAAERRTTISGILAEGAEFMLARMTNQADGDELRRRARSAEEALRGGLYKGPPVSRDADDLLYGAAPRATRRTNRS